MALRQEVAVPKVESQLEREHRERYRDREDDHDCGRRARFRDATWRGCGGILASPSRVGTTGSVEYDHPRGSTVPHRFFGLPGTIVRVEVRLVPASGSRLTGSGAIPKEMFSPGGTNATILAIRAGRRGGRGWPRQSPRDPGTHDATPA